MTNDNDALTSKRTRGRPRSGENSPIVEQLLEAAERLLRDHSYLDLTEQKIAAAAGVSKAMIHYYFGDKDGLLFEVIVRTTDDIMEKLKVLDATHPEPKTVTRHIVKTLIDTFYAKPWIEKIMVSEATRSGSVLREMFVNKYGPQEMGPIYLRRILEELVSRGIYDSRINIEHAAMSLFCVITAPLMLAQLSSDIEMALDKFKKDDWIDHVADLFDRQLRI